MLIRRQQYHLNTSARQRLYVPRVLPGRAHWIDPVALQMFR